MKSMIVKKMTGIVTMIILVILAFFMLIQMFHYRENLDKESYVLFGQVEEILAKNGEEQDTVIAEYNQLCLNYADAVAYILSENPAIMDNVEELNKIAGFMQIDEIHIFDETGTIVKGSVPKYFGYSVYDGEQIGFFKQMLTDKSMRLCQETMPNTAEEKEMQYAAVWSEDGSFFVQVGITPYRLLEVIRKNQLSYIFSLLTTKSGAILYAIDVESGEILGSTDEQAIGKKLDDMKMSVEQFTDKSNGFFVYVEGKGVYCVGTIYQESILLLRTCSVEVLYEDLWKDTLLTAICLTGIAIFMVCIMAHFLNEDIVQSICNINKKLTVITDGKLDERVDVDRYPEFEELSSHINAMIQSILSTTDKMSYVLDHAMLPIGVYEYNSKMKAVRTTKQIQKILCLSDEETEQLFADYRLFKKHIDKLKKNPIKGFENTYQLDCSKDHYIRVESFQKDDNFLGIIIDVTEGVLRSRRLEKERNFDALTGIYNRRGLDDKLEELFELPNRQEELKYSALVMLDADGLKQINDTYGHKAGDKYLCEIAGLLQKIEPPKRIFGRQGGDEFVLFYYGCETEEELMSYIEELNQKRDNAVFMADEVHLVPIRFSFGYVLCHEKEENYSTLNREADLNMYEEKKKRKMKRA